MTRHRLNVLRLRCRIVDTLAVSMALILCVAAASGAQDEAAPDRSSPPTPGEPPALKVPPVVRQSLSNGLPVWIVEMHEVPVVEVSLVLEAGSAQDPEGKFGLASMTASMLDEGAGTRSSLEIADAIDYLGATLETGSSFDAAVVDLGVPVARLADALPIMADVAQRPTFPERELTRLRRERLTGMLQARDNPSAIAAEAFPRLLYGKAHRYGTGEAGTPSAVESFTVDDLRSFYQQRYQPARAALIVVGDVQPSNVVPLLESAFGSWKPPAAGTPSADLPAAGDPTARRIVIVNKPGAPQSQIRVGWIGVPRSTPDYFALEVMNTVLGGSFSSRLNQNLREEHGYAYGAGSGFAMRREAGPFAAGAAVQADKTAESLTEFFKELNRIRQPVPEAELQRAKNYLAFGLPAGFETTGDLSARLQDLLVYHLPTDYYDHYVERLRAVSAADVQRAAEAHVHPDRSLTVVVGDAKATEQKVRVLDLGAMTVMSVDEVLGPPPAIPPQ
jgi:predicted Zn-dependent peptidase